MPLRYRLPFALSALCAVAPLSAQHDSITPDAVRRHVMRLAADSMRGRATPSRQLDQAARYAATQFRRANLIPLGDSGTFLQHYKILTTRLVADSSTVKITGPTSATWRLGRDVDWLRGSEVSPRLVAGPVVVLTGLPDSLRPFGPLDVRGAIVVHFASMNENGGVEAPFWMFRAAARAGVAGWIQVVQRDSADWHRLTSNIREPRTLISGHKDAVPFPVLEMLDETMGQFLADAGLKQAGVRPLPAPAPAPAFLSDYRLQLRLVERVLTRRTAANVLAMLPGTDTVGAGTLLVMAHIDGLGIGEWVGKDSIYNGADDDASGVAVVLEAAAALSRSPTTRPRHSVVFALFSGTEPGLWGSAYYIAHPVAPLSETVGAINVESIGRNMKDSLTVIRGPTTTPLEGAVDRAARAHAAELGLAVIHDPAPNRRLWLQGDHSQFLALGIPILYLHNGMHGDLHQPGDEPQKIDFESTARIARFVTALVREAATPTPTGELP